jgi:arylformamidase
MPPVPDPHPDCSLPPDELEREYSPSSMVGGSAAPFVRDYAERSADAVHGLGDRVEVLADGSRLVRAGAGAPLFVFVHGGYWQALSAAESVFLAPAVVARGWSYGAVEYTIAPAGTVEEMIAECREAVIGLIRAAGSPERVVVAGHSAGAHLVAMSTLVDGSALPVERVVLVSGVFDLRPVQMTSVNDALGWTPEQAERLSPALHEATGHPAVTVVWGGRDTAAFGRQSLAYAAQLRDQGLVVDERVYTARHHFDILDELAGLLDVAPAETA